MNRCNSMVMASPRAAGPGAPAHRRPAARVRRPGISLLLLALLVVLPVACGGGVDRAQRSAGSAVWVRPADLEQLDAEVRQTLRNGGIGELFVEAGRLVAGDGTAAPRLEPALDGGMEIPRLRLPVTLAVTGELAAALVTDDAAPGTAAAGLAGQLRRLRLLAEELGLTPVGYHLDAASPATVEAVKGYARFLESLRGELDPDLHLSISLDPAALDREGVREVVRAVDFVVPFLYGVRPDGGPAPAGEAAWDLSRAQERLEQLAELGRPFLVGAGTLGVVRRIDGRGQPVEEGTGPGLRELVDHRALERGRTAVLQGLDRKEYLFEVTAPARVGAWTLSRGERLLVLRPYPHHLRDLARRAREAAPELHLGQLYVRLPGPEESLSPGPAALAAAEADRPAAPRLAVELEPVGDRRDRLRVRLVNEGEHPTDLATLATNYVELRSRGGTFDSVEAGDFQRYQLEHGGERVTHMRALRSADGVKLFAPLVEPGEVVESGTVALRGVGRGGPVVDVTGLFATPAGELVELPVRPWPALESGSAETADAP